MSKTYPAEAAAEAIQAARKLCDSISGHAAGLRLDLEDLERQIAIIRQTDDAPDLRRISERFHRLRQLRQTMELGSWAAITVPNALRDAWSRLP